MIGKTISHYHVTEKLCEGFTSGVYRAFDEKFGREVVLKFFHTEFANDNQFMAPFKREAQVLASLNHPNIAAIYGWEEYDGLLFLVMEFVEGTTLAERIVKGRLPLEEVLNVAQQIAEAVESVHEKGFIHCNLKPGNVIVTSKGRAKVLDFSLAKLLKPEGHDVSTMSESSTTTVAGTLPYMAPEQLLGDPVDGRTDLYSLGVLLYEAATGRRPFLEDTAPKLMDAILNRPPTPPLRVNPDLPPELDRIIQKLLKKDRKLRYQTASDLLSDLKRLKRDTDTLHLR